MLYAVSRGLRNVGLVMGCLCVGFAGVSLVEAEPRFVTARKIEATPTATDAAEAVCLLAEKSRVRTTCTVDAFMHRIDLRINVKGKDADKVCTGAVDIISSNTRLFFGLGWTLRVLPDNPNKPAHRNTDQPLAVCGIR
jgi:hypothetical protein